jgi:methylphosphotriester-DNA--protein-cysteine methyltransferase
VCPRRRPSDTWFFAGLAAEREGFRSCRRCRPGPRRDPLDLETHAELVERALAIVEDAGTVSALARRLGVSTGHLRRAFATEIGGTPGRVVRGAVGAVGLMALLFGMVWEARR